MTEIRPHTTSMVSISLLADLGSGTSVGSTDPVGDEENRCVEVR
jgi:hypothetical protein